MSDSVTKYFENSDSTIPNQFSDNNRENLAKNGNIIEEGDKIVQDVVRKFKSRSAVGIDKYGTTLYNSPDGFYTFLNHLSEELMDATLYIEKIKQLSDGKGNTED